MKKYVLPVILLAIGAGIASAASFAARQGNCCQPAKNCCEAKSACCETTSSATVGNDCCQPVQSCCEAEGGCCGLVNSTGLADQ